MNTDHCFLCDKRCLSHDLQCQRGRMISEASDSDLSDEEVRKDVLLACMIRCGHMLFKGRGGRHGQMRILRILEDNSHITQKELQNKLDIQPGSMSEIITKLESKGWIIRTKDPADKRKMILTITDEGRAAHEEGRNQLNIGGRKLFDVLDEKEQMELAVILNKLLENWNQEK